MEQYWNFDNLNSNTHLSYVLNMLYFWIINALCDIIPLELMKNKDRNKAGISTISTTPTFLTDNTDCIDHNLGFIHALHRAR